MRLIIGIGLEQARPRPCAARPLLVSTTRGEIAERRRAFRRRRAPARRRWRRSAARPVAVPQARLAADDRAHGRRRSNSSSAHSRAIASLDVAERQAEDVPQPRLDALARAQGRHRLGRARAGLEEGLRAALAEPEAQRLQVADQGEIALPLGARPASRRASRGRAIAPRAPPAGGSPGVSPASDGKAGEQALREGVDGLDAQAAAGRFEHAGEQGAGLGAAPRARDPRRARRARRRDRHP